MELDTEKITEQYDSGDEITIEPMTFGQRLRQIRKELEETQDEFAARIGTSKQVLSRYESGQRTPKISLVEKYAQSLQVSVDYLMGQGEKEAAFDSICTQSEKPFYKIFIDVTMKMGLGISDIVRVTGLTDRQIRTIIQRRMKEAPLPIALQISKTLGVPLEVWTGNEAYKRGEISAEGREVAMAYDQASHKDKNMVRMALDMPPLAEKGNDL